MNDRQTIDVLIVGGGAAGIFAALQVKAIAPHLSVVVLEKQRQLLTKVKISGGGRCNVTHACWTPDKLVEYYPRGQKEMLGPFHRFMTGDMVHWLSEHGVETKIEEDGRIFPVTDRSQTIIDCFLAEAESLGVSIRTKEGVLSIQAGDNAYLLTSAMQRYKARAVIWATGSAPAGLRILQDLSVPLVDRVPSLFAFDVPLPWLHALAGISIPWSKVYLPVANMETEGPLLLTHKGLSGPGILKLSSWAAYELAAVKYKCRIHVNWIAKNKAEAMETIHQMRKQHGAKKVEQQALFGLPKRLWKALVIAAAVNGLPWADLNKKQLQSLVHHLCSHNLPIKGKSTHKEEFVTAGGVDTRWINFTSMEHKQFPSLYFAGEVLHIDALTGGFNFQAAWTTAWIAAQAISMRLTAEE